MFFPCRSASEKRTPSAEQTCKGQPPLQVAERATELTRDRPFVNFCRWRRGEGGRAKASRGAARRPRKIDRMARGGRMILYFSATGNSRHVAEAIATHWRQGRLG